MKNSLIDFLAAYGPIPDGNNMYDEFVVNESIKTGLNPLQISESRSAEVAKLLLADNPVSVILTGTAGDGKTYTARKVFEMIHGVNWESNQTEYPKVRLKKTGYTITFIKDMSELDSEQKSKIIQRFLAAVHKESGTREVFVLCVNDGHLLKTWTDHAGHSKEAKKVLETLRKLLRDDKDYAPDLDLRLFNMSRTSHSETLDSIIDAMLSHDAWKQCPSRCCASDPDKPCPIRLNREILSENGPQTIRGRLRSLIEIAAADDQHLSIRQIMILVVNALLGDGSNPVKPLMNCARAQTLSHNKQYIHTNPYSNIFGENHSEARRRQYTAFSVLNRFGIGDETNNYFDDRLLNPLSNDDLPDHPIYGTPIFSQTRANYIEDSDKYIGDLRQEIRCQRRRLFFSVPDVVFDKDRSTSPWQLSIYHAGDLYINLIKSEKNRERQAYKDSQKRIVRAMNRTLTGALTESSNALWLPQPSGVYLGQEVPLGFIPAVRWGRNFDRFYIALEFSETPGRPARLQLHSREKDHSLAALELTPTLFEYLTRVSDGVLPTSFSNQCLRDIRNFQIRAVGAIESLGKEEEQQFQYFAVDIFGEELKAEAITMLEEDI